MLNNGQLSTNNIHHNSHYNQSNSNQHQSLISDNSLLFQEINKRDVKNIIINSKALRQPQGQTKRPENVTYSTKVGETRNKINFDQQAAIIPSQSQYQRQKQTQDLQLSQNDIVNAVKSYDSVNFDQYSYMYQQFIRSKTNGTLTEQMILEIPNMTLITVKSPGDRHQLIQSVRPKIDIQDQQLLLTNASNSAQRAAHNNPNPHLQTPQQQVIVPPLQANSANLPKNDMQSQQNDICSTPNLFHDKSDSQITNKVKSDIMKYTKTAPAADIGVKPQQSQQQQNDNEISDEISDYIASDLEKAQNHLIQMKNSNNDLENITKNIPPIASHNSEFQPVKEDISSDASGKYEILNSSNQSTNNAEQLFTPNSMIFLANNAFMYKLTCEDIECSGYDCAIFQILGTRFQLPMCECNQTILTHDCSRCKNMKLDPQSNCSTCINQDRDVQQECKYCKSGRKYDPLNCTRCIDKKYQAGNCDAECSDDNMDIASDCNDCIGDFVHLNSECISKPHQQFTVFFGLMFSHAAVVVLLIVLAIQNLRKHGKGCKLCLPRKANKKLNIEVQQIDDQ